MSTPSKALVRADETKETKTVVPFAEGTVSTPTSIRQFMQAVMTALSDQMHVNQVHSQLHSMNFFMNYANAERGARISRDVAVVKSDIREGQLVLSNMQTQVVSQQRAITDLTTSVEAVTAGVEKQQEMLEGLTQTVDEQKATVTRALQEYDRKLTHQEEMIRNQEETLQRLLAVRLRVDLGVDVGIVLVSWWLTSARLLKFVLNSFGSLAVPTGALLKSQRRHRIEMFSKLVRLVLFLGLVRNLRSKAVENGLHNMVGGYTRYSELAFGAVRSILGSVTGRIASTGPGAKVAAALSSVSEVLGYSNSSAGSAGGGGLDSAASLSSVSPAALTFVADSSGGTTTTADSAAAASSSSPSVAGSGSGGGSGSTGGTSDAAGASSIAQLTGGWWASSTAAAPSTGSGGEGVPAAAAGDARRAVPLRVVDLSGSLKAPASASSSGGKPAR